LREISRLLVQAEHPDSQQRQSARAHRDQVCDKLAVELKQAANDLEADKSRIVEVAAIRAMLNTLQHELAAQAPNAFA